MHAGGFFVFVLYHPLIWAATRSGVRVDWSRLGAARTILLTLLGFLAIAAGAFLIYIPAGLITLGVALVLLAYLTDAPGVRR